MNDAKIIGNTILKFHMSRSGIVNIKKEELSLKLFLIACLAFKPKSENGDGGTTFANCSMSNLKNNSHK